MTEYGCRAFTYLFTDDFCKNSVCDEHQNKCHIGLFQSNTTTVMTVATAYPSSQLHPPNIVC